MLACPSRTLEVMPYALAARVEDAGLCACDLQVGGPRTKRRMRVYSDAITAQLFPIAFLCASSVAPSEKNTRRQSSAAAFLRDLSINPLE